MVLRRSNTDLQQYYLRARYYDTNNGRFNRTDPFAGNSQDPQSLHKNLYCHANPVNGIDPTGLFGYFSTTNVITAISIGAVIGAITFSVTKSWKKAVFVGVTAALISFLVLPLLAVWAQGSAVALMGSEAAKWCFARQLLFVLSIFLTAARWVALEMIMSGYMILNQLAIPLPIVKTKNRLF